MTVLMSGGRPRTSPSTAMISIILFFGVYSSAFWILNHWFHSWRNRLFEIKNVEGYFEDTIRIQISNTFNDNISKLLYRGMLFIKEILRKFDIPRADFKKGYEYPTERDKLLGRIRDAIRFTQLPLLFPFIFISIDLIE